MGHVPAVSHRVKMLRDGAKQGGQAHSAGWHRMGTSRAVAEQACRIVLRRMQDHLGACGGLDEKCDVGDGDERSPQGPVMSTTFAGEGRTM